MPYGFKCTIDINPPNSCKVFAQILSSLRKLSFKTQVLSTLRWFGRDAPSIAILSSQLFKVAVKLKFSTKNIVCFKVVNTEYYLHESA